MRFAFELLVLSLIFIVIQSKKLVFIQCITRHGVRYPSFPNPHDHSNISEIQKSRSQLTNQGRHMHFILGRVLYKKYWDQLFPKQAQTKFNNSLILAKSTNTNRTIQSLQNLLLGLFYQVQHDQIHFKEGTQFYPPFKSFSEKLFDEQGDIYWSKQRTIPIHVQKGAEGDPGIANSYNQGDFLVKQEYNLCPNQKFWQEENYKSDLVNKIMSSEGMLKAVDALKPYFPNYKLDFQNLYKVVDNYFCLKAMGRPYLRIFENQQIKSYLQFSRIAKLYITYLNTQTQIKTFSHTLLATTIYNMKKAVENRGPKMVFYSGHDVTIGILLTALNLTSSKCLFQSFIQHKNVPNCYLDYPHFASSFIFQLWQEENNYYVEISINGQKLRLPICNDSQSCSLSQFQAWFKANTIQNSPNQECGVPSVKSQQIYIEMALVFSLGVAIPFVLYCCFENKKKKEQISLQSSSLNLEDDIE